MNTHTYHENINMTERYVRVALSVGAIIAVVETTVGASVVAAVSFPAVALAMTALVGWDPLKAGVTNVMHLMGSHSGQRPVTHGR